jgi:hypothetical protein
LRGGYSSYSWITIRGRGMWASLGINTFYYPFRYFHEEVLLCFNDEFKGDTSLKFVKNQPPEGFGREAEEIK